MTESTSEAPVELPDQNSGQPNEPSQENRTTTSNQPAVWADVGILLIHLAVLVYPLWLFLWQIPEYLKLLQQYQTRLTAEAHFFADVSNFLLAHLFWALPLFLLGFLALEILLLKKSEGADWRKFWLLGMIVIPFGVSAWVQSSFFLLLHQISS